MIELLWKCALLGGFGFMSGYVGYRVGRYGFGPIDAAQQSSPTRGGQERNPAAPKPPTADMVFKGTKTPGDVRLAPPTVWPTPPPPPKGSGT